MQTNYRNRQHQGYLDEQPELAAIVREWLESLNLDTPGYGVAFGDPSIEALECHARDGFIPHIHNRGGFDLVYQTDVGSCCGSGCGPNLVAIDRHVEWAYADAKADFMRDRAAALAGIPEDKVNYNDLYAAGRGDLAEELSEYESGRMETSVWWGVRAMYEGADAAGTHTLMVYCAGNVDEYHGAFGRGSQTLAEHEIRFRSPDELRAALAGITAQVTAAF